MADRGRRAFPLSSILIFEADNAHNFKLHRQRVQTIKSSIDVSPPQDHAHFHYNAKRAMQRAERLFDIERENRLLMEKMQRCATRQSPKSIAAWSARGCLNFKQGMLYSPTSGTLQVDHINARATDNMVKKAGSYRKRQEVQQLMKDNLRIMSKIQNKEPVYSARKFEHDHLENVSRIERLSTFNRSRSAKGRVYMPKAVEENLDLAKSMRQTAWRPGTAGYERQLSRSATRMRELKSAGSARVPGASSVPGKEASQSSDV